MTAPHSCASTPDRRTLATISPTSTILRVVFGSWAPFRARIVRPGYRWRIVVCLLLPLLAVARAPVAAAALPLGGGAGIIVNGIYCTLTTIGHDKTGDLVGFTAASCGGPDSPVVAEGSEDLGPVGTVVAIGNNPGLDYAVIKFDPTKITPIANFAGFVINSIGPDPEWHQPECRLGAATGDFCSDNSTIPGPGPHMSMPRGDYQPGDNGGPVTSNDQLIGMITDGTFMPGYAGQFQVHPPHQFTHMTKFSRILDDVNVGDAPGSGFIPISA
ncbi:serine protease [Mycobacterium sp. M1]|uniref:Serine protease n=1 Tax=Mycolicibacter acidiphilus TaxID=2835306 RepID=A0ABS5RJ77_9MYCO|nr:serine protease [Mycolicibacter acidiphilus]MBS9534057.1 serine protease [Mycolicibacter acidiphilus]